MVRKRTSKISCKTKRCLSCDHWWKKSNFLSEKGEKMIREILVSLVIVSLILLGNFMSQEYTKNSVEELT